MPIENLVKVVMGWSKPSVYEPLKVRLMWRKLTPDRLLSAKLCAGILAGLQIAGKSVVVHYVLEWHSRLDRPVLLV